MPVDRQPVFVPPLALDAVIANEGAVRTIYLDPAQVLTLRQSKTVIEMLCGWCATRGRQPPTRLCPTTQENWERAIGLVVCGLAERIQL